MVITDYGVKPQSCGCRNALTKPYSLQHWTNHELRHEIYKLLDRNESLKYQLNQERSKPWWKRLLGGLWE